jgi:hypothetical protein
MRGFRGGGGVTAPRMVSTNDVSSRLVSHFLAKRSDMLVSSHEKKRVDCTYGFLTWVNHADIYVELLDAGNLHFTIEELLAEACVNKQIFGELAGLLCDFLSIAPLFKV